jgi:hypothetical protein
MNRDTREMLAATIRGREGDIVSRTVKVAGEQIDGLRTQLQ